MRRTFLLLWLCVWGSSTLEAQITAVSKAKAASNNGSTRWSVGLTPAAGDTLLVGCDYTAGVQFSSVSDSAGDKFLQLGSGAFAQDFSAQAYLATSVKGGYTTVTCAATSAPQYNEIYVTELKGVDPVHPLDAQVSVSGPRSPATGSLATSHANELVWAYVQSGQASNASGWTALSTLDGNLIADRPQAAAGTVSARFAVTMDWTLILAALNPAGTSNSSGSGSTGPISVVVSPDSASVQVSQSCAFTASLQNDSQNRGVTWTISGSGCSGASCGTLTNVTSTSVTYSAPAAVPAPAMVTLTATAVDDTTKSSSASITVTAAPQPISVSVSPVSSSLQVSQTGNFTAAIQNDSQNKGVTWSLSGTGCSGASCGTLSNVGAASVAYTAPAVVPSPATVTLTATSVDDTSKSASATITVRAAPSSAGAPALVQHVSHSNTQTHFVNSYAIRFAFATGSGNCVLVAVQSSGGSVPTVTDDAGNIYTQVINATDSTNTDLTLFKAPVTNPGAQKLQVAFSNAADYVAAEASEFMNVDPGCALDGASTNAGIGAQLTAGNIRTTTNDDLIYAFGVQDTTTNPIQSWTAGAGFSLLGADVMDSHFTEWQAQSAAGTVNPSATLAPANNWFMAAMVIKAGNSGTAPNGIHGVHNLHLALPAGQAYPLTVQFPCTTTAGPIVVIGNAEPSNDFTGLSDSNGNLWTKRGAVSMNYSGLADIWDTDAAPTTCSPNMTVTIQKTGTDTIGSTLIFIDVSNCGPQPCFDSGPGYVNQGGTQSVGGLVAGQPITPTTPTGACFASMAVDANSIIGVSPPALFLASTANPEPPDFQDDENNGYAVIYNPGTGGFTWTWQENGPVTSWASGTTCYKGTP